MTADPEGLVVLTEAKTGFEAETIAHSLEAQGVRATVADAMTTELFSGAIGSAKVMVRRADLETARNALRAIKAESVDIDWSELDVGESDEHSVERKWSTRRRLVILAIFGVGALGLLLVFAGANADSSGTRAAGAILFFAAAAMGFGTMIASRPSAKSAQRPGGDQAA
jgi:hypothetical protein